MKKDAVWGGNIEIQAFSNLYNVNVVVHMLNQPPYISVSENATRAIHLSYHHGQHYNSVRWKDDVNDNVPREIPLIVEAVVETKTEIKTEGIKEEEEVKLSGVVPIQMSDVLPTNKVNGVSDTLLDIKAKMDNGVIGRNNVKEEDKERYKEAEKQQGHDKIQNQEDNKEEIK